MVGRVLEVSFDELAADYDESQQTLGDFGAVNATAVAVVSKIDDDREKLVDEQFPELGMPKQHLSYFHKRRGEYRRNDAIADPHNRAADELDLDEKYVDYVRESDEAQRALAELTERVRFGETITLVCYEDGEDFCHRHLLQKMIRTRLQGSLQSEVTQ